MTTHRTETLSSRGVSLTLLLVVSIIFVVRSYQVFGPDSVYVQPFNSDSALPVLMANDNTIDLFRAYIYGQDQIGAWPFLIGQLIHKATGFAWSPRSIYLAQVVWLSLSILLAASLSRPFGILIGLIVAIVLSLNPVASHYFFVLNQRNAWQCSSLFLAWFFLRRVCNQLSSESRAPAVVLNLVALAGSTFLSIWSSSLDGPFLLALAVLEFIRLRTLDRSHPILSPGKLARVFIPLFVAILLEVILKAAYHNHSLKHFGTDFKTPTQIDWANFGVNLANQWRIFIQQPWWPLVLFGMGAPLAAFAYLVSRVRGETSSQHDGEGKANLLVMICGCGLVAWGSLLVTLLFTWVRLNAYGPRYLAQTHMFGSLAGLITVVLLTRLVAGKVAENRKLLVAAPVAAALVWMLMFPVVQRGPEFAALQSVANGLVQKDNHLVLLGGYWDTYALAALAPPGKIVAVPANDQLMRTPWSIDQMRASTLVTVVHHKFSQQSPVETPTPYEKFGDGQNPPEFISQYGANLRLLTPKWYEQNGYVFSLYSNDSGHR